jgi:hypothetical protein
MHCLYFIDVTYATYAKIEYVRMRQWRYQDLEVGGKHGERGARAYMGVWG